MAFTEWTWALTPQFTGRQQAAKPAVAGPVQLIVQVSRFAAE